MSDVGLEIFTKGRVRVLTLDRPDRKNALSRALMAALVEALTEADEDHDIGAVVLAGAGGTFCAGADLKEMASRDREDESYAGPYDRPEPNPFEIIAVLTKPVIAAIEGPAIAAGMELALACDLRVAGASAWFCLPEAKRGFAAQFAAVTLPRTIAPALAAEWLYSARKISAEEARAANFLNFLSEPGEALESAMGLAGQIAANAPLSLRHMKHLAQDSREMTLAKALRHRPGPDPYTSDDRQEGVRAFLEKRDPVWSGR